MYSSPWLISACFSIILLCYFLILSLKKSREAKAKTMRANLALENEKEKNKQLQETLSEVQSQLDRSLHDPITQLSSWPLFEDRLQMNIKESARYKLISGILFVDLDDFKLINDVIGREIGNALLFEVGARLQNCIRTVDSCARMTKDRFVVSLTKLVSPESSTSVALRILQTLSEPFQIKEHELFLTACIGIAIYPNMGNDVETLLSHAEIALNRAKEKGKNTYQFYQEKNKHKNQHEIIFYKKLNDQTVYQQFEIHYRPIIDVNEEKIISMEAYLEWKPEALEPVASDQIFSMANRQGKLNQITEWLIKAACTQFKTWRELGFNPQTIVIPVSVRQLENASFIFQLAQTLKSISFESDCLILKISEWPAHFQSDLLEKAFHMLDYLKIKTILTNFGSNAFSLQDLKHFPINYLKLDPDFIKNITEDPENQKWVKTITGMADNLSVQFIATDVENENQKILLRQLGCHLIQGQFSADLKVVKELEMTQ